MDIQNCDSVVLEHVQESCLSGVVEAEEEEFGVLVQQAEGSEDIEDCGRDMSVSSFLTQVE